MSIFMTLHIVQVYVFNGVETVQKEHDYTLS